MSLCDCGRVTSHKYDLSQCRICWCHRYQKVTYAVMVEAAAKYGRVSATNAALSPPTPPASPTCLHRGDELTSAGKIALGLAPHKSWAPCDKGLGIQGHSCACEGCGPNCREYTTDGTAPLRTVNIVGLHPDKHTTNCSILRHNGRTLLAYRVGWESSNVRLCELDAAYRPIAGTDKILALVHPHAMGGQEDPRLFVYAGKLHVAFIGVRATSLTDRTPIPRQLFARLTDDGQVKHVWEPIYQRSARIEKNWQPFEYDGTLYVVYSMNPWRILRLENGMAYEFAEGLGLTWDYGDCRGGAPPVRRGDRYYAFFHGTDKRPQAGDRRVPSIYTMGAVEFAGTPPFQPLRITPHPILSPDMSQVPPGPADREGAKWFAATVYPCGAFADEERNRWVVSFGFHDHWCRVAEFSFDQIEATLAPL